MTGEDPLGPQRLAAMRTSYVEGGLDVSDLAPTWLEQLRRWIADAALHELLEPNAMVLATASGDGTTSARTVLLKALDEHGLVFFTNYESRKAEQIAENPHAALLFPWHPLQRQVTIEGTVERIAPEDSDAYWASRPHGSQIGALASRQSQIIAGRAELEDTAADLERRFSGHPIPRPSHWGGYRLEPNAVEFWQGRLDRLHDRLRYRRHAGEWVVERLAP